MFVNRPADFSGLPADLKADEAPAPRRYVRASLDPGGETEAPAPRPPGRIGAAALAARLRETAIRAALDRRSPAGKAARILAQALPLPLRRRIARRVAAGAADRALPDDALRLADRDAIAAHIASLPHQPLLSVIMPVFDTPERLLREALESVCAQLYPNWELCVADDASALAHVPTVLREFAQRDSRIRFIRRARNGGIACATNAALALARGEFVALMDHDDLISETALYEIAVEIDAHPDVDMIYSDEDVVDERGQRSGGYFKSDFNPELLLGQNMVNHLGVYRRSLVNAIGGMRGGFDGAQDYDLALRAWSASSPPRIRHIPAVLYHWRRDTRAPSFSERDMPRCVEAARRAVQDHLDREGEGAKVVAAPVAASYSRVLRKIPKKAPLVSIIVPTHDRADLLSVCANGLLNGTDYPEIELLIVDHESSEPKSLALLERLKSDPRVRVLPWRGAFNYSAMNNMAAREARGEVLALLNNDIEVLDSDWLREMVSHAIRAEVGCVGAKLLYPTGRIQHAGVVMGIGGSAGHVFHDIDAEAPGYASLALLTRGVSAVTGACLVVRKALYWQAGGLNEKFLPVAFSDVDLCLKLQQAGYRNVWTPFAELLHRESASRGLDEGTANEPRFLKERKYMRQRWASVLENDPFYNPNLSLDSHHYATVSPSRRQEPWTRADWAA